MKLLAENEKGDLPDVIAQAKPGELIVVPETPKPALDAEADKVPLPLRAPAPAAVKGEAPVDAGAAGEISQSTLDEGFEEFPEDYPDFYDPNAVPTLISEAEINIRRRREDVRGQLALIYTGATFGMFILGFIVAIWDAMLRNTSIIDNLSTILPLISGIFLGSLGFVLGYYFRKMENDNE